MNKNVLYRSIPKVDILLADEGIKVLIEAYSRESVMEAIHSEMEKLRAYIGTCDDEEKAKHQIALLNENIAKAVAAMHTPNMKKVINGTGSTRQLRPSVYAISIDSKQVVGPKYGKQYAYR